VRIAKLREQLGAIGADAAIVTTLINVQYLTGFTGSSALLWIDHKSARLFTDGRYTIQAKQQTAGKGVAVQIVKGGALKALEKFKEKYQGKRVAIENQRIGFALATGIKKLFKIAKLDNAIERLRMVKDAGEIAAIRASVELNAKTLAQALKSYKPGMSETALAARIDYEQRLLGASGTAFDTIVASGAHSALPHAQPRNVAINANGYLLIDMGATHTDYKSDLTRTFGVGRPSRRAKDIYDAVLEAQLAAIDAIKPGVEAQKLHEITSKTLRKYKLHKLFTHSTGHGLGLEIHEAPRLGTGDATVLEAGMAITIEPGVYVEGFGGVRIEDTVLVTATGVEVLTPLTIAPKHWTIVG
jgi:Xaa-Pro aminopeptidase